MVVERRAEVLDPAALLELVADGDGAERPVTDGSCPLTVVRLGPDPAALDDLPVGALTWRVVAVLRSGDASAPPPAVADVALCTGEAGPGWVAVPPADDALASLEATCLTAPLAAATLAQVLRVNERLGLPGGLLVESLAYSMLQSGPEFAAWLRTQPRRQHRRSAEPVRVSRDGETIVLTLDRPEVRNAYDSLTRDALVSVLRPLAELAEPPPVRLEGAGPVFSSGGDLSEFGATPDPVTAHAVRTARSPGLLLRRVGATARLQGRCVGAGIELPAFCPVVEAAPGTTFSLPEVPMGLIPGAGGTASITARVGRQRCAYLALSDAPLPLAAALAWGLVDRVVDPAT